MAIKNRVILFVFFFLCGLFFANTSVLAASLTGCRYIDQSQPNQLDNTYYYGSGAIKLYFTGMDQGQEYGFRLKPAESSAWDLFLSYPLNFYSERKMYNGGVIDLTKNTPSRLNVQTLFPTGSIISKDFNLEFVKYTSSDQEVLCDLGKVVLSSESLLCEFKVWTQSTSGQQCYASNANYCLDANLPLFAEVKVTDAGSPASGIDVRIEQDGRTGDGGPLTDSSGIATRQLSSQSAGPMTLTATAIVRNGLSVENKNCRGSLALRLNSSCVDAQGNQVCTTTPTTLNPGKPDIAKFEVCSQIPNITLKSQCDTCHSSDGIWTAIGCITTTPKGIAERFITLALGLGGGVALLTTIAGGFILTTSQGDPQRANSAKEMITASVVGLLFIIFSVVILQFIGVTILRIPGFGSS